MHAFIEGGACTNNISEGWNNRLSTLVPRAHPSISLLLEKLKLEQEHTETVLERAEIGEPPKKKRRGFAARQDRLRTIIENANGNYNVN
jgi:hypothetical protein